MPKNTNRAAQTLHEGPTSLEEPSTAPFDDADPITFPTPAVEKLFEQFYLALPESVLGRGLPYVDRIFFDEKLHLPHVWISLKVAFTDPSTATISSIREELEVLAALISRLFERGVAISAEIDPGDPQ